MTQFTCYVCNKIFEKSELELHFLNSHSNDYTTPKNEEKPKLTTNNVPTCNICDKVFSFKSNLVRHLNEFHTFEKSRTRSSESTQNFVCDICEKIYARYDTLRRHFKVVHDRAKTKIYTHNPVESPVTCSKCHKTLKHSRNLKEHIEVIHLGKIGTNSNSSTFTSKCEYCQKLFCRPGVLKKHIARKHNESRDLVGGGGQGGHGPSKISGFTK